MNNSLSLFVPQCYIPATAHFIVHSDGGRRLLFLGPKVSTLTPTEQMLLWIEECEVAARDHDVPRLLKLLAVVNAALDAEVARSRKPRDFGFPNHPYLS